MGCSTHPKNELKRGDIVIYSLSSWWNVDIEVTFQILQGDPK